MRDLLVTLKILDDIVQYCGRKGPIEPVKRVICSLVFLLSPSNKIQNCLLLRVTLLVIMAAQGGLRLQ